jgi:hypothetical protein
MENLKQLKKIKVFEKERKKSNKNIKKVKIFIVLILPYFYVKQPNNADPNPTAKKIAAESASK